jgi:hypothetical protein
MVGWETQAMSGRRRIGQLGGVRRTLVVGFVIGIALGTPARAQLPFEGEPIQYLTAPVNDPIARLQKRLERGETKLKYDDKHGFLESVLKVLKVPVSSQMLVFSKTSFQRHRISPQAPRAVYFGDDVYIGWVQGGDVLEISTVDPKQGATYYLLAQEPDEKPVFQRQTHDCLQCHASAKTQDVPGHLVRSVYPDDDGMPVFNAGTFTTSHESPLKERWGGWYVTGKHGAQRHMGNVFVTDKDQPERLNTDAGANLTDLSRLVDTGPYLAPSSDIVALMVLEHQTQMHNFITAANYQARLALHYEKGINEALGRPADALSETTARRIHSAAEKLVKYILFVDEAPLSAKVEGTSSFEKDFTSKGPRDKRGRSLRDFDLERRLFRYPCSYLIYSAAFDALPAPAKTYVYHRLYEVLTGRDTSSEFAHLSGEDRRAILKILRETKPGLPDEWREE